MTLSPWPPGRLFLYLTLTRSRSSIAGELAGRTDYPCPHPGPHVPLKRPVYISSAATSLEPLVDAVGGQNINYEQISQENVDAWVCLEIAPRMNLQNAGTISSKTITSFHAEAPFPVVN